MRKVLILTVLGGVIFGVSAVGAWRLRSHSLNPSETESPPTPDLQPESREPQPPEEPQVAGGVAASRGAELPVAVRPRPMSVEELIRYGTSLNEREQALIAREAELQSQELRVQLAMTDLAGEQAALEGLRGDVDRQLAAVKAQLAEVAEARRLLAEEQQKAEQTRAATQQTQIEVSDSRRENVRQTATWLQSMEPLKAADVLREMSNDGRLEEAVLLLGQLEERDVAKILSALDDAKLVDQLIKRFQDYRRPEKSTASRR